MHRLSALLLAATTAGAQDAADTSYRFAVDPTPAQRLLLHRHFDVLGACCSVDPGATGPIEVIVLPEELQAFRTIAPRAQLVDRGRPFREIAAERALARPVDGPGTEYLTVAEAEQLMDQAAATWPSLARKVDISLLPGGQLTHEGRHMFALKVSDNVAVDEDEPAILIAAQSHARELNSPIMVTGAWDRVLSGYAADPALQSVVDGCELWFVPVMNPDGVEHVWNVDNFWRKNRRNNGSGSFGVDQNRNYPFLWGLCGASTLTSSSTYRGPSPGSEPEVQTMRNLVALLRPEIYLDFHSYGREVLRMWAPCATVDPIMAAWQQRYADDLRTPMSYATRDPSASGEAPEDHYSAGGTLSFLTEIGTSFQPLYSSTVTEEARVWPGVRRALTTWRPTLRGHVRSSLGGTPIEATVTFAPNTMQHGEQTRSRARDGRYALWLPLGIWDVTWSAPGYHGRSRRVDVATYDAPVQVEVELDPVSPVPVLAKQGSERIGTTVTLTYTSPGDAGRVHLIGWSLGTSPGIDLGGLRVIPLNGDFLMEAAMRGNPILAPTWGTLDAGGTAQAFLTIPGEPALAGLTTYVAGITWEPGYTFGVKKWSAPVPITVQP